MSWSDRMRSGVHARLTKLPGKLGLVARKANDALGRPLADAAELEDRRAFGAKTSGQPVVVTPAPAASSSGANVAPVIVYHMDKTRRDAGKLVEILEANQIPHTVTNIQEDPAAQFAVRRDSHGVRLPVVFVAGECLGGREHLVNLATTGELKRKVFGAS